jgi:hypothetical protein
MASFNKMPSGKWRAQVRLRRQHLSKSFRLKSEAESWAREAEIAATSGKSAKAARISEKTAFNPDRSPYRRYEGGWQGAEAK